METVSMQLSWRNLRKKKEQFGQQVVVLNRFIKYIKTYKISGLEPYLQTKISSLLLSYWRDFLTWASNQSQNNHHQETTKHPFKTPYALAVSQVLYPKLNVPNQTFI